MAHLELRHVEAALALPKREAALVELELAGDGAAVPVRSGSRRAGDARRDIVAVEQLRLGRVEVEVERGPTAREGHRAGARIWCRRPASGPQWLENQPRAAEPAAGVKAGRSTMPVTALSSRAFCVFSEPRISGSTSRPPMSAPIASGRTGRTPRSRTGATRCRPGPNSEAARTTARSSAPAIELAPAKRREARLGPADRLAVA